MERSCRQQAHIDAPVEVVWDLLGDPNRHPEWWPKMIEADCADIEQGCRYRGVVAGPLGKEEHEMLLEELDECREITIACEGTGVSTRFELTGAQGGTFVEGWFGIEPDSLGMKAFAAVAGRRYLKSWLGQSLEGLKLAAEGVPAA
jgi:Polyketide cyclase / dehydrase and lipid transport